MNQPVTFGKLIAVGVTVLIAVLSSWVQLYSRVTALESLADGYEASVKEVNGNVKLMNERLRDIQVKQAVILDRLDRNQELD